MQIDTLPEHLIGVVGSVLKPHDTATISSWRMSLFLLMLAYSVCREALAKQDMKRLASLMDRNFDLRLSMFGEAALGQTNLKMISLARSVGGKPCSCCDSAVLWYQAL